MMILRTTVPRLAELTRGGSQKRSASVTGMVRDVYEYSTLYYGGWMARHQRSHLKQSPAS